MWIGGGGKKENDFIALKEKISFKRPLSVYINPKIMKLKFAISAKM